MGNLSALIYDLEIIKGIPGKTRIPKIEYCEGWNDFENMGISVGAYGWLDEEPIHAFYWEDEGDRQRFVEALQAADIISGFNSLSFDDNLLSANGVKAQTNYDILLEVRLAAYGSTSWKDQPETASYRSADIVEANGMEKTGDGALAPVKWQKGERKWVLDYCHNDVFIERETLKLLLQGTLKDPNNSQVLQGRPLEAYAY